MANFNLGPLTSWQTVGMGELYAFDVLEDQIRHVEFEFLSDVPVTVSAIDGDVIYPIANGSGHNTVKFTIANTIGVVFDGPADAHVCIKTRTETQVIADDGSVSYTTIEPRQREVPDQMRRYMLMMNLNAQRREAAMREEFSRKLAERNEVIERERAPSLAERQAAANPPAPAEPAAPAPEPQPQTEAKK